MAGSTLNPAANRSIIGQQSEGGLLATFAKYLKTEVLVSELDLGSHQIVVR
jgi:hypothetical protein